MKKGKTKIHKKLTTSLVIPTYNREEVLINTLQSAFALKPAPDEILVVDQTLEHEKTTERALKKMDQEGRIRWIKQQPPSVTNARNRLITEAKGDVLVFIDDDVDMPKDFLANHLKNYQNEKVAAVAGRVRQEREVSYPKPKNGKWPRVLDYKYLSVFSMKRVEGVANFMGCNHSVRASVVREIGGYDKNYRGQSLFEETDLAIRIWKFGGIIVYDPEVHLFHFFAPSGGCRIKVDRKPYPEWWIPFNRHYFAFRHLRYIGEFWRSLIFKDFRETVLRKTNVFRPWRIPWSVCSYFYSLIMAARMASEKNHAEKLTKSN